MTLIGNSDTHAHGQALGPRSVDFTDGGFFSGLFYAVGRSKIKNKIKLLNQTFFSELNNFKSVGRLKKKIEKYIFGGYFQRICVKFDFPAQKWLYLG